MEVKISFIFQTKFLHVLMGELDAIHHFLIGVIIGLLEAHLWGLLSSLVNFGWDKKIISYPCFLWKIHTIYTLYFNNPS